MTIAASPFSAARRRAVAVPGGTIAGLEFGPADRPLDILFLHANGFNAGTYADILSPLGDQLRILAVDQRGHGRTTLPADPEAHDAWLVFRDDLLALLDALGETPRVMAGHSMGGTVSLHAAAERADAAERLVLFVPVVMTLERVASLRGYLEDGLLEGEDGLLHLSCRPEWEAANFGAHHHDTVGAFSRSSVPIRILKAEIGSTCGLEAREIAALTGGRARTEVIPGTSHFLPMERPDLVRAALREAAA